MGQRSRPRQKNQMVGHASVPLGRKTMSTYRILGFVAWTWVVIGLGAFLAGALIEVVGAPKWLPLPWWGFTHFVESTDGRVYVSILPRRVLCYDAQGRFLASYRAPDGGTGSARLASDLKGRIFCLGINRLNVYDSSWRLLAEYRVGSDRTWRLDENGDVVPAPSELGVPVVDRSAAPEEYIFSFDHHRESFACMDGSRLVRKRNHLDRYSQDGHLVARYSASWILYPLTFPWPVATAGPLVCLCVYVADRRKRLLQQLGASDLARALLLDVITTVIMAGSFAAVWLKMLSVLVTVNNAQPQGSPWRPWLTVASVVWFFLIPLAGFKVWSAVQKRLVKLGTPRQEPTPTGVIADSAGGPGGQSLPPRQSGQQDTGANACPPR